MAELNTDQNLKQFNNNTCEIRFYPILEIDSEIVEFHKQIRNVLPIYKKRDTLKANTTGVREIKLHRFESEDGKIAITVSNSNLLVERPDCFEIENFVNDVKKFSKIFFQVFSHYMGIIKFIGMRLINDFNFQSENMNIKDVINYFNFGLNEGEIIKKNIISFSFEERYDLNKARFKRFIGFQKDNNLNILIIRVDLDSNNGDLNLNANDLDELIERQKENIENELLYITSKELKEILTKIKKGE